MPFISKDHSKLLPEVYIVFVVPPPDVVVGDTVPTCPPAPYGESDVTVADILLFAVSIVIFGTVSQLLPV